MKARSPRYPAISLPEAEEAVDRIWHKHQRSAITELEVAKAMGYSSVSGATRPKTSALKKYGLMEAASKSWKLTERAVRLTQHELGSVERGAALRAAFDDIDLFRDLRSGLGDASFETVKRHMIVELQFTTDGAAKAASAYEDSLAALPVDLPEQTGKSKSAAVAEANGVLPLRTPISAGAAADALDAPEVRQEQSAIGASTATLIWPAVLTPDDFDDLRYWLEGVLRKAERSIKAPATSRQECSKAELLNSLLIPSSIEDEPEAHDGN